MANGQQTGYRSMGYAIVRAAEFETVALPSAMRPFSMLLVGRLQQARAQYSVNFNCTPNHLI